MFKNRYEYFTIWFSSLENCLTSLKTSITSFYSKLIARWQYKFDDGLSSAAGAVTKPFMPSDVGLFSRLIAAQDSMCLKKQEMKLLVIERTSSSKNCLSFKQNGKGAYTRGCQSTLSLLSCAT